MAKNELYVAVGTVDDPYSAAWKLWTQGDEFYALQSSGAGRLCKVTVHKSGICRLANVDRTAEDRADWGVTRVGTGDLETDPDVIHRWEVTKPGSGEVQSVLTLLVPTLFMRARPSLADHPWFRKTDKVVWVPGAPLGFSTLIDCIRVPAGTDPESGIGATPERVLGTLSLRCGDVVYVVRNRQRLPQNDLEYWQREVTQAVFTTPDEITEPVFASIISPADFSFPVIREVALGVDNFKQVDPIPGLRPGPAKTKKKGNRKRR